MLVWKKAVIPDTSLSIDHTTYCPKPEAQNLYFP